MSDVYGHDYAETLDAADGVSNGDDWIWGFTARTRSSDSTATTTSLAAKAPTGSTAVPALPTLRTITFPSRRFRQPSDRTRINGTAERDTLVNVEGVDGSFYDDLLVGNDLHNPLLGNGGNDTLKGGGGDDLLAGGSGADTLDGGEGFDTASYAGSPVGVHVSLIDDIAALGHAEGDELNSIENLGGSSSTTSSGATTASTRLTARAATTR